MNLMLPALKIPLIVPFLKTDSGHMMYLIGDGGVHCLKGSKKNFGTLLSTESNKMPIITKQELLVVTNVL